MTRRHNAFHGFCFRYRRSSTLLKCSVLAVLLLSTAALLMMRSTVRQQQEEVSRLQGQAMVLELENSTLRDRIAGLGSVESIRQIAGDELGLVDPGTTVFSPAG